MGFRSLVSLALVSLPIGATLGLLLGWNSVRAARGEQPLFTSNTFSTEKYCQKSYGITPSAVGQQYTLNPNQWGWNVGDPGHLCMHVTSFANSTYATTATAPKFSVTWEYPAGNPDQPVHAFPNIKLDADDVLPAYVNTLSSVNVDVEWTYGVGSKPVQTIDEAALTTAGMNANVAIDMFLDSDPTKATNTIDATYEVMVWLGRFGDATDPIGLPQGMVTSRTVNTTLFYLYTGQNSLKQHVFTWVAQAPASEFVGDVSHLLHGLGKHNGPRGTDYIGYVGFGSETYFTTEKVTFSVPYLSMKVKTR